MRNAPTNLTAKQGTGSGTAQVSFTSHVQGDPAEVQICTGDPNLDTNWQYAATLANNSGLLRGFTPGVLVWFRVRSSGPGGLMGAWSTTASLRVI